MRPRGHRKERSGRWVDAFEFEVSPVCANFVRSNTEPGPLFQLRCGRCNFFISSFKTEVVPQIFVRKRTFNNKKKKHPRNFVLLFYCALFPPYFLFVYGRTKTNKNIFFLSDSDDIFFLYTNERVKSVYWNGRHLKLKASGKEKRLTVVFHYDPGPYINFNVNLIAMN